MHSHVLHSRLHRFSPILLLLIPFVHCDSWPVVAMRAMQCTFPLCVCVCTMERVLKEFQHVGFSVAFIVSATKMRCDASAKTKYYTVVAWRRYDDAADDDAPIPRTVRINICALQNMN